jgi:hypothetical protein
MLRRTMKESLRRPQRRGEYAAEHDRGTGYYYNTHRRIYASSSQSSYQCRGSEARAMIRLLSTSTSQRGASVKEKYLLV